MGVDEDIKAIEEEIHKTQYNKATQHHIGLLKAKLSRLRGKKEGGGGKKGEGYSVRKSGDASVVLVGFPSVGKSTLLNRLTNAQSKIGAYAFTTLTVVPGVMEHKAAKIQVLDVPGIIRGAASGSGRGREVIAVVRNADLVVFVIDPFSLAHREVLKKELEAANIRIDEIIPRVKIKKKEKGGLDIASTVRLTKIDRTLVADVFKEFKMTNASIVIRDDINVEQLIDAIEGNRVYLPSVTVVNKCDTASTSQLDKLKNRLPGAVYISAEKDRDITVLKDAMFRRLDLIRIFLKEVGKKPDMETPIIMRAGCNIRDVCARLHADFVKKFKYAKVSGPSSKFPWQMFRADHGLLDGDIVEVHLR